MQTPNVSNTYKVSQSLRSMSASASAARHTTAAINFNMAADQKVGVELVKSHCLIYLHPDSRPRDWGNYCTTFLRWAPLSLA